ncbi:hypothetical protein Naga_100431g7, partial [Nannochloropsis gaditana]
MIALGLVQTLADVKTERLERPRAGPGGRSSGKHPLPSMHDSYRLYQFTCDVEDAACEGLGLPLPSPSSLRFPPLPPSTGPAEAPLGLSQRWAFPARTAHNSLILDMGLAKEMEAAFAWGAPTPAPCPASLPTAPVPDS